MADPGGDVVMVATDAASPITLPLAPGRYAVRASIVAWEDEPGARGPDGRPSPNALPDFLVVISPSTGSEAFRTSEVTFDPPADGNATHGPV